MLVCVLKWIESVICICISPSSGFLGSTAGKESTCNMGDLGSIPGLGRSPRGGHGNPLQYSFLENPHGQRSLAGFSTWGCKESDMTEQLNTAQHPLSLGAPTHCHPTSRSSQVPVLYYGFPLAICLTHVVYVGQCQSPPSLSLPPHVCRSIL